MVALLLTALITAWSPEAAIKEYIRNNYPWPDVQVQIIGNNGERNSPYPGSISVVSGNIPGRITLLFSSPAGENTYVEAVVDVFDWVVSNRRAMSRGETIGAEDIYKSMVNIKNIPKGAIKSESACLGKVLTYSIAVNRPITESILADAAVIRKGEEVRIVIESEKFKITAKGIAKEDGAEGKYIKVLCPLTNKLITGKVTGSRIVTVLN
ncbi:MAG: flagellar basal body P-ring formation protein FlgA [Nitrospirae bacterium]|nr:flagellar basal body P-ring formation protein FlgA [Nitrospirota bacterium]